MHFSWNLNSTAQVRWRRKKCAALSCIGMTDYSITFQVHDLSISSEFKRKREKKREKCPINSVLYLDPSWGDFWSEDFVVELTHDISTSIRSTVFFSCARNCKGDHRASPAFCLFVCFPFGFIAMTSYDIIEPNHLLNRSKHPNSFLLTRYLTISHSSLRMLRTKSVVLLTLFIAFFGELFIIAAAVYFVHFSQWNATSQAQFRVTWCGMIYIERVKNTYTYMYRTSSAIQNILFIYISAWIELCTWCALDCVFWHLRNGHKVQYHVDFICVNKLTELKCNKNDFFSSFNQFKTQWVRAECSERNQMMKKTKCMCNLYDSKNWRKRKRFRS